MAYKRLQQGADGTQSGGTQTLRAGDTHDILFEIAACVGTLEVTKASHALFSGRRWYLKNITYPIAGAGTDPLFRGVPAHTQRYHNRSPLRRSPHAVTPCKRTRRWNQGGTPVRVFHGLGAAVPFRDVSRSPISEAGQAKLLITKGIPGNPVATRGLTTR